jgi:hypothetical protein
MSLLRGCVPSSNAGFLQRGYRLDRLAHVSLQASLQSSPALGVSFKTEINKTTPQV